MDDFEVKKDVPRAKEAPRADERRAFEEWGAAKKVEAWKVNAAKHLRVWAIGFEVTESEFDQAIYDACNHVMR